MKYLLDSNTLIDSYNKQYPIYNVPNLWKNLAQSDTFCMTKRVYNEIIKIEDSLSDWVKENFKDKLIDENVAVTEYASLVQYFVQNTRWSPAGYNQWLQIGEKADPWLIAYAMYNHEYSIISHEANKNPNVGSQSSREPKIPFVAKENGVQVFHLWEVIVKEKIIL